MYLGYMPSAGKTFTTDRAFQYGLNTPFPFKFNLFLLQNRKRKPKKKEVKVLHDLVQRNETKNLVSLPIFPSIFRKKEKRV